jgi:hypothetical protein
LHLPSPGIDLRCAHDQPHAALDRGLNVIDTGDFYGMGKNELLIAGPRYPAPLMATLDSER